MTRFNPLTDRLHRGRSGLCALFAAVFSSSAPVAVPAPGTAQEAVGADEAIPLPEVRHGGEVSVEKALTDRRSVRHYTADPLTIEELSQLLWSGQGVTETMGGLRTAPSAGALYPLELYAVVGEVSGLDPGLYRYAPVEHAVRRVSTDDLRAAVGDAASRERAIYAAPVTLVIAGVVERTAVKYGERARRYVHIEVGAAAQNISLQAESLALGTFLIGAFDDRLVKEALALPDDQEVFGIMPVGQRPENWRDIR